MLAPYRGAIEAALAYAGETHTYEDIVAGIDAGNFQAWPGQRAIVITAVDAQPQAKILHFFLAGGGDLPELERMTSGILDWGRAQGCARAVFLGRRGWERTFLTRTGWEVQPLVVLEKAL